MNPSNPSSRVFLAEPVSDRYDIRDVKNHGHVIYLYEPNFEAGEPSRRNAFDVQGNIEFFISRLQQQGFNPSKDFLCMTGHNMMTAALMSAGFLLFEDLVLLAFNSSDKTYFEVEANPKIESSVSDPSLSYEDWLRKQTKEVQDDRLGPERAELFREGKLCLKDQIDSKSQSIPLSDLRDK